MVTPALPFHGLSGVDEGARTPLPHLLAVLVLAAALYGAVFGAWRGGQQMAWSAAKMPALMLSVTAASAVGNTLLAQTFGWPCPLRETLRAMLTVFATASVLLASLGPVLVFLALSLPDPEPDRLGTYRLLLCLHTGAMALAGLTGLSRLRSTIIRLAGPRRAGRVFVAWLLLTGAAGSELSWLFSPFLSRPDRPLMLANPNAFRMNMYEYLGYHLFGVGRPPI